VSVRTLAGTVGSFLNGDVGIEVHVLHRVQQPHTLGQWPAERLALDDHEAPLLDQPAQAAQHRTAPVAVDHDLVDVLRSG
jgi:hypothetical protein